jgi:hypothetical protein
MQNTSLNLTDFQAKNEHIATAQDLSFIHSLAEPYGSFGQESTKKMVNSLNKHALRIIYCTKVKKFTVLESFKIDKIALEKILAENNYKIWKPTVLNEVDEFGNWMVKLIGIRDQENSNSGFDYFKLVRLKTTQVSSEENDGEIAEILQSQAGFTIATDKKPIVATFGCGPCVALGGYDSINKIAFVVHFATVEEVRISADLIFCNINRLAMKKINKPVQLHLRGGFKHVSEDIIEAIEILIKTNENLSMEFVSKDILDSRGMTGKSLSIDSRTGTISNYSPKTNPHSRGMSDLDGMFAMMSAFEPNIRLVYRPK